MNLFVNPSLNELYKLISTAKNTKSLHDVVVDFDGEVLIDPDLERPDLVPAKFKFHVQITELSKKAIIKGSNSLKFLFNILMNTWTEDSYYLNNLQ